MYSNRDEDAFESLKGALRGDLRASVLVGAGISVSAGVPTAHAIVRRLKRLGKIKAITSYASAMQEAFKDQTERREFINRTFEGRPPSAEHYQLGCLLSNRVFKDALTTNFDHLLEIATSQACDEPVFVYPTQKALEGFPPVGQSPRIVKLHGDFLFQSLANTDAEMGGVGTAGMYQALRDLTLDTSLVVFGFAGDRSVLDILESLVERHPSCLPSIWWFFHNPPGLEFDKEPTKAAEYQRVSEFLGKIERTGRMTHLVRNVYGVGWVLEELGRNANLTVTKPSFGIGPTRYIGPYRAWGTRTGTKAMLTPNLLPYLQKVEEHLRNPGLIVLRGQTCSGKSTILKSLSCSPERPTFYFSFVHARNLPEDHSFLSDLQDCLRQRQLLSETNEQESWFEILLKSDGVLVLDDLPLTFTLGRRTADFGPIRRSFLHVLLPALKLIAEKQKGNVVLVLPDAFRDSHRDGLYQILDSLSGLQISELRVISENQPAIFKDYKRLSRRLKTIVNSMIWLRFAEPPEVIAKLSNSDGSVLDELSELVSAGFVSECFGTYILRIEFRNLLTNYALNTWKTERLESTLQSLVDVFTEEADDPEQINPRHYLLEVENACFSSTAGFGTGLWRKGVRTLATMTRAFLSNELNAEFFLATLSGFHELAGKRVFEECDLIDLTTLYGLFSSPTHSEAFPDLSHQFWKEVKDRGPAVGLWLSARKSLENSAFLDAPAVVKLLRAISQLHRYIAPSSATAEDWHLLGSLHLTVGKAAIAHATQELSKSVIRRALRHTRAAYHCFVESGKQESVDDAESQLGNIYMTIGQLRVAKRYFLGLLRRERNLPGFEPVKAASLHNMFCISLGLGDMRRAEGFFWEANYLYVHTTRTMSLLALAVLAGTRASPLPFIPVASLPDRLNQLPSAQASAEKAASIASTVSGGIREDTLLRTCAAFGKVAGTLYNNGELSESKSIVESTLIMLDESLPISSLSFDESLILRLAESVIRYVRPSLGEWISTDFINGLSNPALKELLRDQTASVSTDC